MAFPSAPAARKLSTSATPPSSVRVPRSEPPVPITGGSPFFRPVRLLLIAVAAAAFWLWAYSGMPGIDL